MRKFWKRKAPNFVANIRRRRPCVVCHEIITAAVAAISAIWKTVVITVAGYAITVGTIIKAVLVVGACWYSYSQSQKAKKLGAMRDSRASGHLINTRATSEPIPIHYGTSRIGGNIVYINCTGPENKYLHMIVTFSEGPVKGIKQDGPGDKIWLDDLRIQDYAPFCSWEFFRGTPDQNVCATLQAADPNWDDAMRYTAYLYLRLEYNEDKFASLPNVTIELEGREIYDPRSDTTAHSANNALVKYDFLRNDRYSIGLSAGVFDIDSIKDAANWCDTNGYQFNGPIMERQAVIDNSDDILRNFRAGLIWSEGEYKLLIYEYDTPVMHLTEDDIDANSFRIVVPGIPDTPNRVIVHYADVVDNYISKSRVIEDINAVLLYDLEERDFELDLKGTIHAEQGTKLGSYYVDRNRLNYQFSFSCHPRAIALEPMDMIQITHSLPGWSGKIVRVLDVEQLQDGRCQLLVISEDPKLYDDIVNVATHQAYETNLPAPTDPPPNITDLILEETYDRPGILISLKRPAKWTNWDYAKIFISTDGTNYSSIATVKTDDPYIYHDVIPGEKYWIKVVSYSIYGVASTMPPIESIVITAEGLRPPVIRGLELLGQGNDAEWKHKDAKFAWRPIMLKSGAGVHPADTELLNAGQGFPDYAWQDYKIEIWVAGKRVRERYTKAPYFTYTFEMNLEDNQAASNTIAIKVWNRSIYNIVSRRPAELTVVNPPPPMPTGVQAWALMNGVRLKWSPSVAIDHDYWLIRTKCESGSWSSWESSTELEYRRYATKEEIQAYGLFPTIYFELKDIDTFGNQSSVASANAECFAIAGLALEDISIETQKIKDNAIETAKIAAGAVETQKLAALAVTAEKIAAETITGDKIAANTIGAGHILAGAIETEKINALAVTAAKIAAGAITADKMDVTALSAITANIGEVTAGIARSSDEKFKIDFTSKWLKVWDGGAVLRVHIGYLA